MNIITAKGRINTEKEAIVLIFNNDDELSSFISMIVKIPVRTSGMRILPLIPENVEFTPFQKAMFDIIEGLDGVLGNDHEKIIDNSIDSINDMLKK